MCWRRELNSTTFLLDRREGKKRSDRIIEVGNSIKTSGCCWGTGLNDRVDSAKDNPCQPSEGVK